MLNWLLYADTTVKLSLLIHGKKVRTKISSTRKSSVNPYFNESFIFDVPFQQIQVS